VQRLRRRLGQARRKARQQPRAGLDEHDARCGRVDMAKVAGERRLCQLGKCAGQLDPGWSATDDHESEEAAPFGFVFAVLGPFKRDQDATPHRRRVLDALQSGGRRGPFIVPEIRFLGAGGDNQLVIENAAAAK